MLSRRNPQLNAHGELIHLLSIEGLPREVLVHILDTAGTFLSVNDREMAQRLVSDSSLLDAAAQNEWGKSKGLWRLAPGTDESAEEMTFFRGPREAYKVRFISREGRWIITDLHSTQRSVE